MRHGDIRIALFAGVVPHGQPDGGDLARSSGAADTSCYTGSIACYKAADLASKLHQAGALVDVVLTQSALQFITPLTFQSLTGRRAYVDAEG